MVVVEPCLTELSPEETREEVLRRAQEFVDALTKPRKLVARVREASEGALRYEGRDLLEALRNLNSDFLDRGWGDGFPIVAPTREALDEMLRGTSRGRDDLVLVMEPGRGLATVEKIAVNCVMAGCRPEHLPVVIAAIEAISEPEFNLPMVSQSTGPICPLLVINGPIRKELGINCGGCVLGPGAPSRVNTVIGRAVRLVMMNIGHAYANIMDMDCIGTPNKYSMCMGENEEASPWEPLHVERGFDRNTSTVTAFPCESFSNVADQVHFVPEQLLDIFAHTANEPNSTAWSWLLPNKPGWNRENLIVFCPEHAQILGKAGWTKEQVRRLMFYKARIPVGLIKAQLLRAGRDTAWNWLLRQPDDMPVQVVRDMKAFHIVVVGGSGPKSAYMFGMGEPVTKEIRS
ncbi:MAG: hypothetical protein HYX92_17805 [Chloroflexi bacterium]|nr:hypothetical protein [Chloroflexota bacterium]